MRFAICNAVLGEPDFALQCSYAAGLGYDGLEVVPATLHPHPAALTDADCAALLSIAASEGIAVTGLHRLLSAVPELSIVTADGVLHARSVAFLKRMIDVCAALGGTVVVHGSPQQRMVAPGQPAGDAWNRARDAWAALGEHAGRCGVTYCIEPLPPDETNFINTLQDAARMVDEIGSPHLRTMIDGKSVLLGESVSLPEAIDAWMPTGRIGHIQLNDSNRRGPGEGPTHFAPVLAALARNGYDGVVAVEPFVFVPDGRTTAARAIGYLRGIEEALGLKGSSK